MSTHLSQLTLTFHEHLTRIAAAPTASAKLIAEWEFEQFLCATLDAMRGRQQHERAVRQQAARARLQHGD